jgi:hypothetical protein
MVIGVFASARRGFSAVPSGHHLHVGQLGKVVADGIVELEPRLLQQDQGGHARHDLRHRVDPADRVRLHGEPSLDVTLAPGLPVHDLPVAGEERDDSRVLALADEALDLGVEPPEALRRHPLRLGCGQGEGWGGRGRGGLRRRHGREHERHHECRDR